jgi:hypothetical protein
MSDRDRNEDWETGDRLDELEEVLVVPSPNGGSGRLVPAIGVIVVALGLLVLRSGLSDWKGIVTQSRIANPPPRADSAKPSPTAAVAPPRIVEVDPMVEITKEAERKRREKGEIERLKDRADDKLAQTPERPVPPRALTTPWQRRRQAEAFARGRRVMDQFLAQARERNERMFNEAIERHRRFQRDFDERFTGPRQGMPFGGMEGHPHGFTAIPLDGEFRQRHGTFRLPEGGRGEWNSTIIIQGFDDRPGD